jgi:hypothetical protein
MPDLGTADRIRRPVRRSDGELPDRRQDRGDVVTLYVHPLRRRRRAAMIRRTDRD